MNDSFKKRIAVLRGGPSSEYDVSMQTGKGIIDALCGTDLSVKDVVISRKGEWLVNGFVRNPQTALMDVDAAFIALHGSYGEDGTVQRVLERLCIPYTGSDSYSSAIAMNKVLTKDFIKKHSASVKMAPHLKLTRESIPNLSQMVHTITELFGPEYVIKPVGGGSSIGTKLARRDDLFRHVSESLNENDEILVEQMIRGKEATVGILEGFRNQRYYKLPAIEIVPPKSAGFFAADVKYNGETEEICPGRFSKYEKEELSMLAEEVHRLLGLRHYSRSDFIVAEDGIYFLEVNTLPGLTSQSLFPKSMEAVGSNYKELVTHLLAQL